MSTLDAPLYVQLDVTDACNLRCTYCYAGSSPDSTLEEPPADELLARMDEVAAAGAFSVVLSGGEPLLRLRDVELLAERARAHGLRLTLNTNATLVTRQVAERLARLDLHSITVNVEGQTSATHDEIRGLEGSLRRTLDGLVHMVRVGLGSRISCVTVVQKRNLPEIPGVLRLASSLGVAEHRLLGLCEVGRAREGGGSQAPTREQWLSLFEALRPVAGRLSIPVVLGHCLQNFVSPRAECSAVNVLPDCQAGTTGCVVATDGSVYACNFLRRPEFLAGNVRRERLLDIWRKAPVLLTLRHHKPTDERCRECPAVWSCRGGCRAWSYLATGSITGTDPRCAWFEGIELDFVGTERARGRQNGATTEHSARTGEKPCDAVG